MNNSNPEPSAVPFQEWLTFNARVKALVPAVLPKRRRISRRARSRSVTAKGDPVLNAVMYTTRSSLRRSVATSRT